MPESVYRQRNPQNSPYYQCVEDHFETFEEVYDERFERRYGFFRPYVKQVIYRYLDCGILKNGFARVRCEDCGHEYLLKAFYTNGVRDSKAVPGAVVAIQTFGLRLGDLRLGEGFSTRISSPPAYTGFRRLFPRKRYVFRFTHC
jgi:hypothetical protein